jgi:dynein heavy chain
MFRFNTGKQLPEEGFHKDLFCGVADGEHVGLIACIECTMKFVFME